jgi:transcriptional regulator with XRE-family HTH domain
MYSHYEGAASMGEATFGEKVKVKREEKGLTQVELAKVAGLTQATISRIESGEVTQLMSENLKKLARALDLTVDFLVGKRERMEFDESLIVDETAKVIFRGYEQLSPERRRQLADFVKYLVERQSKER